MVYFIISVAVIAFLFWQYILQVYEIRYVLSDEKLYTGKESSIILSAVPLNSFGKQAPFRKTSDLKINFIKGEEKVDTIYLESGKVKFLSRGKTGIVSFTVNSEYSLVPSKLSFDILD